MCHYDVIGHRAWLRSTEITKTFCRETNRPYREFDNTIPGGRETQDDLELALGKYRSADLIVTSRLHGCIIGVAMGKRVLALSRDHKVDEFMKQADLSDWVCDPEDSEMFEARLQMLVAQPNRAYFVTETRRKNIAVAQAILSGMFATSFDPIGGTSAIDTTSLPGSA